MEIRQYEEKDEKGWIRCRVLSFLDTAYYDHVLQEKEKFNNPAIELVTVIDGQIVGLLDIEYEAEEGLYQRWRVRWNDLAHCCPSRSSKKGNWQVSFE